MKLHSSFSRLIDWSDGNINEHSLCITSVLWAKQGEHGILHEAWDEREEWDEHKAETRGGEKNKVSVTRPLFWLFPCSLHECHTPIIGQLMTHCSGEILVCLSGTKWLSCSHVLKMLLEKALHLVPNVP